jgi:hypothetical protein
VFDPLRVPAEPHSAVAGDSRVVFTVFTIVKDEREVFFTMFIPEAAEIVGYKNGAPVIRRTSHGGGTFTSLHCVEEVYSRAVYRGGGMRGDRAEEDAIIARLEPVLPGYRLQVPRRITAVINGSLEELQEAIAQLDDERVPTIEDSTLDTRSEPTLWCDEWDRLWRDAMWQAPLTLSERREAHVSPEVGEALERANMSEVLNPGATGTVCLILPTDIDFFMALKLRRQSLHDDRNQACHFFVALEGLPKERFIAGVLELRERIIAGDREAEELFVAACGQCYPTPLLTAEDGDMLGALLALSLEDSYDERVADKLRQSPPPWGAYARTLGATLGP